MSKNLDEIKIAKKLRKSQNRSGMLMINVSLTNTEVF